MNASEFEAELNAPMPVDAERCGTAAISMIAEFARAAHDRGVSDTMLAQHFANVAIVHARRAGMDESAVERMFEIARRMSAAMPRTNAPGGES